IGFLMHQPPHALLELVENQMGKLLRIINDYQNPLKYADIHADSIKIHVGFSGVLLEQLLHTEIVDACRKIIDIPLVLAEYRESKAVEIIGMGYSHPIFSLIPPEDWDSHIFLGKEMLMEVFGKEPKGFWLPGIGFCPEMIPVLRKYGYEYIVTDRLPSAIENVCQRQDKTDLLGYAPVNVAYHNAEIGVVPIQKGFYLAGRKADSSQAEDIPFQQGGQPGQRDSLLVIWTHIDKALERETHGSSEDSDFWNGIFSPYLEGLFQNEAEVRSVFLREYVRESRERPSIDVQDSCQSVHESLKSYRNKAVDEIWRLSFIYRELKSALIQKGDRCLHQPYLARLLEKAQRWLSWSESSCFFSQDPYWTAKLYDHAKPGFILLEEVRKKLL
ncbi:MAG: hypothetical protein ACMUIA_07600, partial [bacterium]